MLEMRNQHENMDMVLELYSICAVFIQYLLICIYDDLEFHMWPLVHESACEPYMRRVRDVISSL